MIEQTADKTRISCGLVRGIPEEETMEQQWFLHIGKTPCHISLTVQQFFAKNQIPPILLSQHSPGIIACDLWVFLRLRIVLKGNCFVSAEEIQQNSAAGLTLILKEDLLMTVPLEHVCMCKRAVF